MRAFLLLCLLAFPGCLSLQRGPQAPNAVNAVGCSLFDMNGKLLKKYLGWTCAFFPNGRMLLGDGFTLTYYDEKMNPIWSRDMHTHHMITYDQAARTATVIASHILNGSQRYDRLEVYDIEGRLLAQFEFQPKDSVAVTPQNWDFPAFPYVKTSHTMVESFYRIGKNDSKLPYLREGNFIVYEASGTLYFFGSALKLEKKVNVREVGLHPEIRDVQVTPAGNLLMYDSGNEKDGKKFTSLIEVTPETWKTVWRYEASPPESLYGKYEGNVQLLPNGHFLFSVVTDELKGKDRRVIREEEREQWMDVQGWHRSYEVTREGKQVWTMANDGSGLSGMPNVVKRYDLSEYFRHKGRY